MNTLKLDPIVSQFDTQQQADDYGQWLTKKVETALKSKTWHTHDEVIDIALRRRAELLTELKNAS